MASGAGVSGAGGLLPLVLCDPRERQIVDRYPKGSGCPLVSALVS